jgi:hypothetical protein
LPGSTGPSLIPQPAPQQRELLAARSVAWTGGADFGTNSLRQSDETVPLYEDTGPAATGSVFAAYRSDFAADRTSSTICTLANGSTATCS